MVGQSFSPLQAFGCGEGRRRVTRPSGSFGTTGGFSMLRTRLCLVTGRGRWQDMSRRRHRAHAVADAIRYVGDSIRYLADAIAEHRSEGSGWEPPPRPEPLPTAEVDAQAMMREVADEWGRCYPTWDDEWGHGKYL